MGLSEINKVVSADYRTPDKEYRSFVMVLPKKEQVDETWRILTEKWQKETQKDKTVLYREVPYEGFIGVIMMDGMITGVSGIEEKAALLKILMENK